MSLLVLTKKKQITTCLQLDMTVVKEIISYTVGNATNIYNSCHQHHWEIENITDNCVQSNSRDYCVHLTNNNKKWLNWLASVPCWERLHVSIT